MDAELENCCPICLDSWEEASFVMPCLHQFCYRCILRWAESKPECPLCKRRILSILHSVRADDNYVEHIITPPVAPPVTVHQVEGARRHPATRGPHQPGAPQRRAGEGVPRGPVGGLRPPNWMNNFHNHPMLLQTLQHWVHQELEELFGNGMLEAATVEGTSTELPGRMLGGSRQNRVATSGQQPARVAVQQRSREAQRPLGWQDTRAAGGQEGSPVGAPGPAASQGGSVAPGPPLSRSPVRYSADELPGTSPTAVGGGPSSQPPAPIAIPVEEEEPQQEPGEAVLGPSTSRRGSERSPGGPRRPPKRKSGSSEASPSNKRPASHQ